MLKSIAPELIGKQASFFVASALLVAGLSQLSFKTLQNWSPLAYWGLVAILALLLVIGIQTRGTAGWFELGGGLKFQPSQLAVPISVLYVLSVIKARTNELPLLECLKLLGLIGLPAVLIGLEPDFGSMMIYLASVGTILLFYRIPKLYWLSLAGLGIVAVLIAWQFFFQPYQKDRIVGFMNPTSHEQTQAETSAQYNARQAMIAVGSGQVFGRGLGYGVQSHLRFLPERQTDFIFAALAEELGLVGSLLVVGCYGVLITLIIWQAGQQVELARSAYLTSIAVLLFVQAGVNIGMNIGLLPITGITLPFLSYGGSSILGLSLALAGVQVIGKETKKRMSLQIR